MIAIGVMIIGIFWVLERIIVDPWEYYPHVGMKNSSLIVLAMKYIGYIIAFIGTIIWLWKHV